MSENEVWVNARTAKNMGFSEAQRVVLENQQGAKSLPVQIRVTEGIRPDCAYMVHGFGHESPKLQRAYHKGASDTQLMTHVEVDPIMGGTGMRVNFVRILRESA